MLSYNLKDNRKRKLTFRVIINSFTGNSQESAQSEEVLRILKAKQVKIEEVLDINQELVFEKEKSKNKFFKF